MGDDLRRGDDDEARLVLVARKGDFGLPTACPHCLPAYLYLRFAGVDFDLDFGLDLVEPLSDHIPYIERGDVVLYNNENGGVIEGLKGQSIVDLDSGVPSSYYEDWLSTKAMVSSVLAEAIQYELWVASDGTVANKIYLSDLSWLKAKIVRWNQIQAVNQQLGLTKLNVAERENRVKEIYRKALLAYEALSLRIGDKKYFFADRPTSLDVVFLGHALFVLHALPHTSVLRSILLINFNLAVYLENYRIQQLLESNSSSLSSSSASVPRYPFDASSSSTPRRKFPYRSSRPNPKAKREKMDEEKTFRRRAKYILAAELISIGVLLSLFGGSGNAELENIEDGMNDL